MNPGLDGKGRLDVNVGVVILGAELKRCLDSLVLGRGGCGLKATRHGGAIRSDFLEINRSRDNLDIVETKLGALGNYSELIVCCENTASRSDIPISPFTSLCQYGISSKRGKRNIPIIMAQPSK